MCLDYMIDLHIGLSIRFECHITRGVICSYLLPMMRRLRLDYYVYTCE
jgi:hypothetical protein